MTLSIKKSVEMMRTASFFFMRMGRDETIGIEVEDIEGMRYLVLRDGTVYVEEGAADVANDH